ncbi:MAG: MerR family transcriptional regulator [Alloprevotella sp.]|nr:MerR family transcriptional regulator [Alloprevotella sp.]MBR1594910.1 MerR family transcriptional regulator [Alloprevotella sp.]MBR1651786.1 MerR family transcriptional regulator [Alloprevotella sp.]
MALNLNKDLKRFFSIAEVAEMFGINATTLRFWEKQFPQITPKKSGRNVRQYTKDDIERVRVVHNLVKVRGMKLDAAAALIRRNKDGVEKTTDILENLREIRAELMGIKHSLAGLE